MAKATPHKDWSKYYQRKPGNGQTATEQTRLITGNYHFVRHETQKNQWHTPGGGLLTTFQIEAWATAQGHGKPVIKIVTIINAKDDF
jgi:hypothetical protein